MQSHECSGPDCRRTVYKDSFMWYKRQKIAQRDHYIYACSEDCYNYFVEYHQRRAGDDVERRDGELSGRFADFVPRFLREYAKLRRRRTTGVTVSAMELQFRTDRANWWVGKLGNKYFEEIDWDMIDRILLEQFETRWKAGTCKKYSDTLSLIFQAASQERIFRPSPYASDPLKAQNPGRGHHFGEANAHVLHRLSREELELVGTIGAGVPNWSTWSAHVATQIAWRAGLRRGEVMGLQWKDVTDTEVTVTQSLVWTGPNRFEITDGSKGGLKERRAPFLVMSEWGEHPDTMKRLLATHRAKIAELQLAIGGAWTSARINEPEAYLFPDTRGNLQRPEFCSKLFMQYCKQLGIVRIRESQRREAGKSEKKEYPPRFHDLRHTYGFLQAHRGLPIATVRDLMGHADIQTTNLYFDNDSDKAAADHYEEQERRRALPSNAL